MFLIVVNSNRNNEFEKTIILNIYFDYINRWVIHITHE